MTLTSTAVVGTLGAWEAVLWPTVWGTVYVEQSVFLLKTEPRLVILGKFHDFSGMVTVVGLVWSAVVVVALSEDENIFATPERVLKDGNWPQVNVGVIARSLAGGRTIEIPDSQLADIGDCFINSLRRWSEDISAGSGSESLTVVLERTPPSQSTQTSAYIGQLRGWR